MNTKGVFPIEINGEMRDTICNFAAIERLERTVFKRPIMAVLNDGVSGNIFFHEVLDCVMTGLWANRDTRFKREEIGNEMAEKGLANYLEWYLKYLTYAVTGKTEVEAEFVSDDDKKK